MTTEHQGEQQEVALDEVPQPFGPHRQGTAEQSFDEWLAEVNAAAEEQERAFAEMAEGSE
jgi:hypothetical protein